jgi:uncharacterized C2H2 Zn-finger protein
MAVLIRLRLLVQVQLVLPIQEKENKKMLFFMVFVFVVAVLWIVFHKEEEKTPRASTIQIVQQGTLPVVYNKECPDCKTIFSYQREDVKRFDTKFGGFLFIDCPKCQKHFRNSYGEYQF